MDEISSNLLNDPEVLKEIDRIKRDEEQKFEECLTNLALEHQDFPEEFKTPGIDLKLIEDIHKQKSNEFSQLNDSIQQFKNKRDDEEIYARKKEELNQEIEKLNKTKEMLDDYLKEVEVFSSDANEIIQRKENEKAQILKITKEAEETHQAYINSFLSTIEHTVKTFNMFDIEELKSEILTEDFEEYLSQM